MITRFINFENYYDPTRVVTNPNPVSSSKKEQKAKFTEDGVFSEEIFGKKNQSEMLSWQCDCGKYKGKFLKGYICEDCQTEVKKTESYLDKLAWIDLGQFYIINPIFYYQISKLCGGVKNFNKIINFECKIDRDGEVLSDTKKLKFENTGLIKFKEEFNEIIVEMHRTSKYQHKDELLAMLLQHKDKIFINHIPVIPVQLRPATITIKDSKPLFKFDEINNNYNFILQFKGIIDKVDEEMNELIILPNLYTIQCKANIVFNKIIDNLAGKTGFIRNSTISNRLNFSARNVITPIESGYEINEISVPYLTFVELYNFQLVNMISKLKKVNMSEAQKIILDAQTVFNEEIYSLCMELVRKSMYGCLVFGIRNPTIARGSIQCLRIANVKKDISDLTTSVHNSILELWAGDYDGDVINLFPIFDNELKILAYNTFSPDMMFISNNDGKFNTKLALDRDQVIGIHQFNKAN